MRVSLALAGLAAIAATFLLRDAGASPSARLVYVRSPEAAGCPGEQELRTAVRARFGYDPFFAWATQTVVVQVWRERGHYRSRVQLVDAKGVARGTRELTSDRDSCLELFDATALAISIAMDAALASVQVSETEPPQPPAPPASSTPPPSPPTNAPDLAAPAEAPQQSTASEPDAQREAAPTSPRGARFFAGLDLVGSAGSAPSLAVGLAAVGGLRAGAVSLGLEMRADAPASASGPGAGTVTSSLYLASVVPCAHYEFASLCGTGAVGWMQASGSGVSTPHGAGTLFVSAGARIALEWPLSQTFSFRVHGDLIADLRRPTFVLDGASAWSAPPVAGSTAMGLLGRFP
jgi:hypothetical protein